MKKLLIPLFLIISGFVFGQGNPMPNYQQFGSAVTLTDFKGAPRGVKGIIIGRYADTLTANNNALGNYIKFYPGAFIVTDNPRDELWQRNYNATAWINRGSFNLTTINFLTDSSVVFCFGNGVCDTIDVNNFSNVVNNIISNNNTTITNLGNSLIVCSGAGSTIHCDTLNFAIDSINNYYFLNDSMAVACDTPRVTQIGDSFVVQQLCDTIRIPPRGRLILQNGIQFVAPGIGEHGHTDAVPNPSQLQKDTYLYTDFYNYGISGAPYQRPTLSVQNKQWTQISSSITSFNSLGGNPFQFSTEPDNENPVNLYVNYMNRFIEGNGVFTGDTIGPMYNRIGYSLMTNAQGIRAGYHLQSATAKQSGIMLHTFDLGYRDAVTIFGNQVPNPYLFSVSPFPTTTLLDSRIAIFKNDKNIQFPGYPNTRNDGVANKAIIPLDTDGNLGVGSVIASTSLVEIISDTSFRVCDLVGACDTFIVDINTPTVINIFNDTTIIICNEAGSCDTIIVNNYTITNGQVINIANTVFVSKAGNDATGQRQRLDLHFLTIRAAETAAIAGDVIVVYPGTYEETDTLWTKNVNYTFVGKGEVRLVTTLDNGVLFYDHGVAKTSVIDAPGWTFTARGNQTAFKHGEDTKVKIIADEITSQTNPAIDFYEGRSYVKATRIYTSNSFATVYYLEEHAVIDADSIVAGINGSAIYFEDCPYFNVSAGQILCGPTNGDYMIYGAATNPTDSVFISADLIRGGTEWPLYVVGDATQVFVNAKKIVANTDCVVVSGTDKMTVTAQEIESTISTDTDGIIHAEGGDLLVIGARLKRNPLATGYDLLSSLGGNLTLSGVSYDQTRVNITGASPGTIKRIDSLWLGSQVRFTNSRMETDTALIAAANNLTLGHGNVNIVSGATQINAITTQGWQAGSPVWLQFSGAPLVKHATAGGAGTAQIKLAGSIDFQAAADDVIGLEYDGTYWHEISRKLAASTSGSLTSFSFTDANGFDGTVTNPTTTPNLTLTTTLTLGSVFFAGAGGAINEDNPNLFFNNTSNTLGIGTNSFTASRLEVVDNSTGGELVRITSTSTAAAANAHRGINVVLSGVNATGSQETAAVRAENSHGNVAGAAITIGGNFSAVNGQTNYGIKATSEGTGSFNYGVWAKASGGSTINYAIYGESGSVAVYGNASGGGTGVIGGNAASGLGVNGQITGTDVGLTVGVKGQALKTAGPALAVWGIASGASTGTNTAAIFEALNGATNYAILVPANSGNVGFGTSTPSSQALLELSSTTQAFIVMRMTATQASAITAADGMMLYVTNTNATFTSVGFWGRENGAWVKL